MKKAIVTLRIPETHLERLKSRCQVVLAGWGKTGRRLTERELSVIAQDAQILLAGYERVSARVIGSAQNLELIGCARATPVNIDVAAATERGIPVLFTPGRNANAAAEFTLGLMLAASRHIARAHHVLKTGDYLGEPASTFSGADPHPDVIWELDGKSPYKDFRGVELCERTAGLIGLGDIGSRVARLCQAFGLRVVAYSPYQDTRKAAALGVELLSLKELLAVSDFVSVHCRVTDETKRLLGKDEFALMKPTAYLINTARAIVIDQEALIEALQNGRIAGAALDVYWNEPLPRNHPLLRLENVTLTPHLAGATVEVAERHSGMIVNDVLTWLDGKTPANIYNREVMGE